MQSCAANAGVSKMRIMLDTNVLLSSLLFPSERMNRMMRFILEGHRLVLSSFVVDELIYVVRRKFPGKLQAVESLLTAMLSGVRPARHIAGAAGADSKAPRTRGVRGAFWL